MKRVTYTDIVLARLNQENVRYQLCVTSNISEQDCLDKIDNAESVWDMPVKIIVLSQFDEGFDILAAYDIVRVQSRPLYAVAIDESGEIIDSCGDLKVT